MEDLRQECTDKCPRCPCEAHRMMYSDTGQWYCARHYRINYQAQGADVPDPKAVRKAQRKVVKKLLNDEWEPMLGMEIAIYLAAIIAFVLWIFFLKWVAGWA